MAVSLRTHMAARETATVRVEASALRALREATLARHGRIGRVLCTEATAALVAHTERLREEATDGQ